GRYMMLSSNFEYLTFRTFDIQLFDTKPEPFKTARLAELGGVKLTGNTGINAGRLYSYLFNETNDLYYDLINPTYNTNAENRYNGQPVSVINSITESRALRFTDVQDLLVAPVDYSTSLMPSGSEPRTYFVRIQGDGTTG